MNCLAEWQSFYLIEGGGGGGGGEGGAEEYLEITIDESRGLKV